MKKLFTAVLILFLMFAMQTFGQTTTIEFAGTVDTSATKTVTVEVGPTVDSVEVSLYATGEIDLDSLDIKLGFRTPRFEYGNYRQDVTYWGSTNTTYSKTLTVNLADGVSTYLAAKTVIPKSVLQGYNLIKASVISATASGSDPTDSSQKLLIIVTKY